MFRFGYLQGYQRLDTTYGAYFQSFFAAMSIVVFAFLTIGLSAFQVAMAYNNAPPTLQATGYWFAITTMCFTAAIVALAVLWFLLTFVDNGLHALGFKR
jgi:hypothetical protein